MFATPGDIPPQAFVRLDQFTAELIDLRADFRAALQQAIGALSESINAQLAKIHENTVHIDDRMRSQFEKVNKTAATNYERLDKRLFIVERDMQTRIQVHDELRADLTETALQLHTAQGALTKSVQSSAQRFTSLKTELSKQLEGVNNHLGNLQEDLTQVNATVESLVANQTGASKAMSFARRADEHVNEQGKMFQSFDNKLEAQAQLLEELQMKIIVSNEEVREQQITGVSFGISSYEIQARRQKQAAAFRLSRWFDSSIKRQRSLWPSRAGTNRFRATSSAHGGAALAAADKTVGTDFNDTWKQFLGPGERGPPRRTR
jgi:hypothetical protein